MDSNSSQGGTGSCLSLDGFPTASLLPRDTTQAAAFLRSRPSCDGRGVVVAIFDTGVDPAAAGLQVTSTGLPKIVDCVDCTGDGDVREWTPVKVDRGLGDGELRISYKQLSVHLGRRSIPSGVVSVAVKSAEHLFPGDVLKKMKAASKQRALSAQRAARLHVLGSRSSTSSSDSPPASLRASSSDNDDLVSCLSILADLPYTPPSFLVILFHDGCTHRVIVDAALDYCDECDSSRSSADDAVHGSADPDVDDDCDGNGEITVKKSTHHVLDLSKAPALATYKLERQYGVFAGCGLSYCINVYNSSADPVVSIVVDSSPHGTHVAGIVAAHFPANRALDGVAPGCQIISCKIGDGRLGGEETAAAVSRAIKVAVDSGAKIINMSFGEPASRSSGFLRRIIDDAVLQHGVTFLASAGNAGPALQTAGAPGGTFSSIIGVAAHVTSDMNVAHSLRAAIPPSPYTWSSRGPNAEGGAGVSISAPGAAITCVPVWTGNAQQLMNGTSMSSPNAAGCFALAASAAIADGVQTSPTSLRRAFENTADAEVGGSSDAWTHGFGCIQVCAAYEYLKQHCQFSDEHLPIIVKCGEGQGVIIREQSDLMPCVVRDVNVKAFFPPDSPPETTCKFSLNLNLTSTASWVTTPSHLALMFSGRDFKIEISTSSLAPGAHSAFIIATATPTSSPSLPPRLLFRIPVTVIIPHPFDSPPPSFAPHITRQFDLDAPPHRLWLTPPHGSKAVEITITLHDTTQEAPVMVWVHYNRPDQTRCSVRRQLTLNATSPHTITEPVSASVPRTIEVGCVRMWSSAAQGKVTMAVSFLGPSIGTSSPASPSVSNGLLVYSTSSFTSAVVSPFPSNGGKFLSSASMHAAVRSLVPSSHKMLHPSDERDSLFDGYQLHTLQLLYDLKLSAKATVTLAVPTLHGVLYESPVASHLWSIKNSNGRVLKWGEALHDYEVSLAEGNYTVTVRVMMDDPKQLEEDFKHTVLSAHIALENALDCSISLEGPHASSKQEHTITLHGSQQRILYIIPPRISKIPKIVKVGDVLVGCLSCIDCTLPQPKDKSKHTHWSASPLHLIVGATAPPDKDDADGSSDCDTAAKSAHERMVAALVDAAVGVIKKMKKMEADKLDAVMQGLKVQFGGEEERPELQLAAAEVLFKWAGGFHTSGSSSGDKRGTEGDKRGEEIRQQLLRCVDFAEKVQSGIDAAAVAAYYGVDHDTSLAGGSEERTVAAKMKLMRQRLRDALLIQTKALCALWHVDEGREEVGMAAECESGSSSSSSSSSSAKGPSAPLSTAASLAFISCGSKLRSWWPVDVEKAVSDADFERVLLQGEVLQAQGRTGAALLLLCKAVKKSKTPSAPLLLGLKRIASRSQPHCPWATFVQAIDALIAAENL